MSAQPIVTDTAVDAAERAMSAAFRSYTGTRPGDDMWNLNMERTWTLVGRAAVEAAAPLLAANALRDVAYNAELLAIGAEVPERDGIERAVRLIRRYADNLAARTEEV